MAGDAPHVRVDVLTGARVSVAPRRGSRPRSVASTPEPCPFCPGNESETPPELLRLSPEGAASWFVRVVPNRYTIAGAVDVPAEPAASTPFQTYAAAAAHEVVIETPDHQQEMAARRPAEIALALGAWRLRLGALLSRPGVRYVAVFKNKGTEAGSSLDHPHSQIVALRHTPAAVQGRLNRSRHHFRSTGRCLLCQEIDAEIEAKERVVLQKEAFIAYVPFGAPFSAQVRLAPRDHAPSFTAASDEQLDAMSHALGRVLIALDAAFESPAYNLVLFTAPRAVRAESAHHWYLDLVPRLARIGGFELATGETISSLTPEAATQAYRDSLR